MNKDQYKQWPVGPNTQCTLKSCWSKRWDRGPSLRFKFESDCGATIVDGMWWMDEMTDSYFDMIVQRSRHIVTTIAGREAWAKAGSPKRLGLDKFFENLAKIVSEHNGAKFRLKTLYKLGADGSKRPRMGVTVSFITPINSSQILAYSDDEREDGRLILG